MPRFLQTLVPAVLLGALPLCQVRAAEGSTLESTLSELGIESPIKAVRHASPQSMARRFFMDALTPFGTWLERPELGSYWKPTVDPKWAPYTKGRWAFSPSGWTWVSEEPFGAIVFHYGRWVQLKGEGWCWVPGMDWAGAWVAWRYGTEHVGWAPLPPEASWKPEVGIAAWADRDFSIGPDHYRFCKISSLGSRRLQPELLPVSQNAERFRKTVNTTNITVYRGSIFSSGPSFDWVSSRAQEPIQPLRLITERSLDKYRSTLASASQDAPPSNAPLSFHSLVAGNEHYVLIPDWKAISDPRKAQKLGFRSEESVAAEKASQTWTEGNDVSAPAPAPLKVVSAPRSTTPGRLTGWESLTDEALRKMLQAKVLREVSGLNASNTPARPVDPEFDLPKPAAPVFAKP